MVVVNVVVFIVGTSYVYEYENIKIRNAYIGMVIVGDGRAVVAVVVENIFGRAVNNEKRKKKKADVKKFRPHNGPGDRRHRNKAIVD